MISLQFKIAGNVQVTQYAMANFTGIGNQCYYNQGYGGNSSYNSFNATYFTSFDIAHIPLCVITTSHVLQVCQASWTAYKFT